ncbi:recombinase family protein [Bacillus sp. PS06]|uniref:recombinase family protein n=1 Tax=Bacillus sp. PS06 TaxID=2764176 RepID=UPI001784B898|nr:recombinase family protein [Bacillus sp. PS06]MBD8070035.1 recombinase family protein [Bacillus sp. PS06]
MLIGYMRPSQEDETCEQQLQTLTALNCHTIYSEDHSSPKKRVKLLELLTNLKPDDKVVINKLSILADSSRHLVELLETFDKKGAFIFSLKEGIDTSKAEGYPFYEIVKHLVEFQSDLISEKTKKGLSDAKEKGITSGRPRKPDKNVQQAIEMYQSKKHTLTQIKEATGISKSTLYRYLEN